MDELNSLYLYLEIKKDRSDLNGLKYTMLVKF